MHTELFSLAVFAGALSCQFERGLALPMRNRYQGQCQQFPGHTKSICGPVPRGQDGSACPAGLCLSVRLSVALSVRLSPTNHDSVATIQTSPDINQSQVGSQQHVFGESQNCHRSLVICSTTLHVSVFRL